MELTGIRKARVATMSAVNISRGADPELVLAVR
jgi:hypothetical protein